MVIAPGRVIVRENRTRLMACSDTSLYSSMLLLKVAAGLQTLKGSQDISRRAPRAAELIKMNSS
jgi:hypothetical protein